MPFVVTQEYREKKRRIALERGYGKWMVGRGGPLSASWKGGNPKCSCGVTLSRRESKQCHKCWGKNHRGKNNPMYGKSRMGCFSPNWDGGRSPEQIKERNRLNRLKNKVKINSRLKELRHLRGVSKKYISAPRGSGNGFSYTKEYKKLQRQKRKALVRGGGELPIKRIQLVYEDNIKKYGTLTCYLCLTPVEFKKDHLEHKIPLSRGGTNEYNNLAIACQRCNCKKHARTEEEYRKEIS